MNDDEPTKITWEDHLAVVLSLPFIILGCLIGGLAAGFYDGFAHWWNRFQDYMNTPNRKLP